jgi:hypothetical protein
MYKGEGRCGAGSQIHPKNRAEQVNQKYGAKSEKFQKLVA